MTELRTQKMIDVAVSYFAAVDKFDVETIMAHMHPACVMEVATHKVFRKNFAEVRETYERRKDMVKTSWHGDFKFMADADNQRLAVRLTVRRTFMDDRTEEIDNVTILQFTDGKISRVSAWMAGENTLK